MIICQINVNVRISSLCHTFLVIRNIHWNLNDIYNLMGYLFIFNNYDTKWAEEKSNIKVCLVELVDRCHAYGSFFTGLDIALLLFR